MTKTLMGRHRVAIDGKLYKRIRYGNEFPDWDIDEYKEQCHDCFVRIDQLHVPGCDVERCPRCSGQLWFYCCDGADDEEVLRIQDAIRECHARFVAPTKIGGGQ